MSTKALINKKLGAVVAALLAAVVAFTLTVPATAHAASLEAGSVKTEQATNAPATKSVAAKKAKTVKKAKFCTATATINKKALKVKKGTTKLNFKGGQGYLKFTAPATKTYKFTFSGVQCANYGGASAFVEVQTPYSSDTSYSFLTNVKTKGGKSNTLWLAYKGHSFNYYSSNLARPIAKRTGSIKLTQGQDIYFYFSGTKKNTKATLKVS